MAELKVRNFGKIEETVEIPDLVAIQRKGYDEFLQMDAAPTKRAHRGLEALFRETFPIESYDKGIILEYLYYELEQPRYNIHECRQLRLTYGYPLKITCRLRNKDGQDIAEQAIYLGEIPVMIGGGEFIINGAERVIVSQLHRSPGVDFLIESKEGDRILHGGRIIPERGSWIEISVTHKDVMVVKIDQSSKIPATVLLRALSADLGTTEQIIRRFYETKEVQKTKLTPDMWVARDIVDTESGEIVIKAGAQVGDKVSVIQQSEIKRIEIAEGVQDALIFNTLAEDDCKSHEQALLKFYIRLRPGNPPNQEKAKQFFEEKFFDVNRYRLGKVGRFRLNRKFGQNVNLADMTLSPDDFINAMKYIIALRNGEGEIDDIDHLGNRRLRTIDELAGGEIRKGLLKLRKTVQERMSTMKDSEQALRIADLVNSKSVSSSINFFFGRGELSQIVDQTNALSQLTHERRLSALGPGGLNRRRAGFEVRDVHISHYGRICPVETPEGTNIGLISSLAIFATVDEYGFLLSPYYKVEKGKVTRDVAYLRADEEMKAIFAPPSAVNRQTGKIYEGPVLARQHGELSQVNSDEVSYVDVSPKQIVGLSAALIPFLEHDDANRALMGSNMQRQSVPLLTSEAPLVQTGMEEVAGRYSSMAVRAQKAGTVTDVDATKVVINHTDEYKLEKFFGLNERTCLNQRPVVKLGQKVEKGQVLADGAGTSEGVLALGKNVLAAFMSYEGFNFEDAIIVSERLVKKDSFTSIHINEFDAEIRETPLGKEEFTGDIPNVSEKALRNLDEHGVVFEGTRVQPGDILVGKVVPKGKTELTPEEKLLHAIFGRAGEDVKNDSLELPNGYEGVVIKTERFVRRGAGGEEGKKALAGQIKEYEKEMRARQCEIFKQMITAITEKHEVDIVDPSTRQKAGASEDDDVIYEQVENWDLKWIKPAAMREKVEKLVEKFVEKIKALEEDKKKRVERLKHGDELPSGVIEMVKIYVATKRTMSIGDKIAGRHGNKGVIAKILPEEDMPFLEDGTPIDILLNPLGVPSRMNVGQILETHLGWVAKVLGFTAVTPVFDGAGEQDIEQLTQEANELMSRRKAEYDGRTSEQASQKVVRWRNLDLDCNTHQGRKNRQELLDLYFSKYLTQFKFVDIENLIGRRLGAEEDKAANNVDGVKSALGLLETALFLRFPDPQPPPRKCKDKDLGAKCRHLPRFNNKLTEKKSDLADRDPHAFRRLVSDQVLSNELLNKVFNECIRAINSPDGWLLCHNKSAQKDAENFVPEKQGLYFFRNQEGVSSADGVAKGYIGLAGDKREGNLRYRICDNHFNASRNDNLPGIFKKHEEWRLLDEQQPPPLQENRQAPPDNEFFINVPKSLKTQLYDGRTGEPFDQQATIGFMYIMKLHHLVDDKIHARSTGPYSLITQQPLGGKARTGGQRFGEMEVWALEGYGAAYTLQEMLTVKSDDVEGRTKIYESMVKGQNTLEAGTPLSFDVLCNEIRGLGLNIQLEKKRLGTTIL